MKASTYLPNLPLKEKLYIMANSTACFILSWFVVVYSNNLFTVWLIRFQGFQASFEYYGIVVRNWNWFMEDKVIIYVFTAVFPLVLGFIFNALYRLKAKFFRQIRLFYLWGYIMSMVWFFGNFIAGGFFNFSYAPIIRIIHPMAGPAIGVLAIVGLIVLGSLSQYKVILSSAKYYKYLDNALYPLFLNYQILFPALLGMLFIFLFKMPQHDYYHYIDFVVLGTILLFLAGLYADVMFLPSQRFKEAPNEVLLIKNIVIAAIVIMLLFRLLFLILEFIR